MPISRLFDPEDWPVAWMARAERQHARNATTLLAPLGLHHREFRLLALLGNSDGLPLGELAERGALERSTVSKMVDRLEGAGWVRRAAHAQDRRLSALNLTRSGRAKLNTAAPIVAGLFRSYQQGIATGEQSRFVGELKAFHRRVHDVGRAQSKPK